MACHHSQAITHTALEILNSTVEIGISEVQAKNSSPHFYGYIYNGHAKEKVRVFPGPQGKPDLKLAELLKLDASQIEDAGIRLQVLITNHWGENEDVVWTGRAHPMSSQHKVDQQIVDHLLSKQAQATAQVELRSPGDVYSGNGQTITIDEPEQITKRNQPNQAEILGLAVYEGRNPYELLTRSTARVEGKTDYPLMVFLRVVADKLGVEVCDLINEVMWESVKTGRIWDCQSSNGMP